MLRAVMVVAVVCRAGVALLRSAPVQGVSRPPHTASRDCRTAHPLPVRSRVRLHRNAGSRGKRKKRANDATRNQRTAAFFVCAPTRSAASRAGMAGWAGEGGGRFGERREYEAPTLPSTPRQHGMARHYTRQAINNTPPQKPGKKRHANRDTSLSGQSPRTNHSTTNPTSPFKPAKSRAKNVSCLRN